MHPEAWVRRQSVSHWRTVGTRAEQRDLFGQVLGETCWDSFTVQAHTIADWPTVGVVELLAESS